MTTQANRIKSAAVVIVAAGRGTRAGGDLPKQWQSLAGQPILARTLDVFRAHPRTDDIVLVLHPDDIERAQPFVGSDIRTVHGGADRATSVRNGLEILGNTKTVLIHDVARPLVSHATVDAVLAALETHRGAAPALAVTDALWTGADGRVTGTTDRTGLFRAQTPQGFDLAAIRAAHAAHPGGAADDVEAARAFGMDVAIVPGDEDNMKITLPEDFGRAERILRGRDGH